MKLDPASETARTSISQQEAKLIDAARSLIPTLKEIAAQQEGEAKVADTLISHLKQAGLFRILQPRRWGGYELNPGVFSEVQMTLAEGDMSTAWVYGVMGVHNFQMALFDDRAAQEVWGDDDSRLISSTYQPGGIATRIPGGYRFNGRWKFSSGVDHAQWVFLGGIHEGEFLTCLVPKSDYQIIHAWDVFGLKATGSQDIVVEDIFVPEYRVHRVSDGFKCDSPGNVVNTAALYRIPFPQVFIRAITSSAIGALQGMLDAFLDYAANRVGSVAGATRNDPDAQSVCAEIVTEIDEMKVIMHRNYDELARQAETGEPPAMELRLRYKYQAAAVPERCLQLAHRLFKCTGGSGIFSTYPFGRYYRDLITARQHAAAQCQVVSRSWGGILLGQENKEWYL